MPRDLPYAIAAICCDAMTEALLAIAHSDDPLGVAIPSQIVYTSCDLVYTSCFPLTNAIPYSYTPSNVTAGNIVTGRCEPCDCGGGSMFCVLCADCRVIDRSEEDRFAVRVGEALPLTVYRQLGAFAPLCAWGWSPDSHCKLLGHIEALEER